MFTKINEEHLERLTNLLPSLEILTDYENRKKYGHDETEDLSFPPEIVVKPKSVDEVSKIMKFATENMLPVTPTGARTGLSGGALCVNGGIALSMEYFNRILEIDELNLQVSTEPGVITQVLQEAVAEKGLYYAPDPASRGTCFIGGNLAENSGGPRAVKYGVTKDWVLNLEVVLPSGDIIWTGANTLKNSTGYNLTQLMVGSEGTLGIITKAVLKLIPLPTKTVLMLVPFNSSKKAAEAVSAIFRAGITPSAMEFMERDALEITSQFIGDDNIKIGPEVQAHLIIELDGNNLETLTEEAMMVSGVLEKFEAGEVLFAQDEAQKDKLWNLRRKVGEAVKSNSVYKEEDTVVPRYRLPELLEGVKEIGKKYNFRTVCFGHAGDGNLHVNILKDDLSDTMWNETLKKGIREIFQLTVGLGGTLSGEHGIGYVQKEFMDIVFSDVHLELMQRIKESFDPNGVLNPGKIFMND